MGNRRLHYTERIHMLGTPESERLKVTALNLFHPIRLLPFPKGGFFHIVTHPPRRKEVQGLTPVARRTSPEDDRITPKENIIMTRCSVVLKSSSVRTYHFCATSLKAFLQRSLILSLFLSIHLSSRPSPGLTSEQYFLRSSLHSFAR